MSVAVPVIETERLILRGHRADDFEALCAMWAHPDVVRFISGKPSTPEESWSRLLRYAGHWQLLGFGFWAVTLKGEDRLLGDVGLADWQRDMDPPLAGMPEAGWVFAPAAHGRGLAREAVTAALSWADRHLPARATACIVSPDNLASIRLAQSCGYREHARSVFKGSAVIQFRR
jgi:RimJ/RimL family protein N-acetyltransferase